MDEMTSTKAILLSILELAKKCKNLEEFIKALEEIING